MKIPQEKIKRYIAVDRLNFDEEITDLIINERTGLLESNNTIEHSILAGITKDFCFQGLKSKKRIYNLKKIKMNIIPEKSLENFWIGLNIQIIYELSLKGFIKGRSKYISSNTLVRFPTVAIYNDIYRGRWIPLYPYVVKKYMYAFDSFEEIAIYNPTDEDCIWKNKENRLKVFFDDANFFINSMELELTDEDYIKIIDYERLGMIRYKSLKENDIAALHRLDYITV